MSDAPIGENDYLPSPVAGDNPPAKRGRRVIVLWVLLIMVFLGVYQLFSVAPHPHPAVPVCREDTSLGWWALPVGFFFLIAGLIWWQLRAGAAFNHLNEPGLIAFAEGDFARAQAVFRETLARYRGKVSHAPVARFSLASSLSHQGKLGEAIDELVRVERSPGLGLTAGIRLLAAIELGRLFALRGELERARRWLAEARRRLARHNNRQYAAAALRVAEAWTACRAGQPAEAARLLDGDWSRLEGALIMSAMREAYLLRAFAAAGQASPRDSSAAEPWLRVVRTARPGSLDYLAREWPALETFLAAAMN